MHVIITTDWSHFEGAAMCGGAFVVRVVSGKTSRCIIKYTRANMNRSCSVTGELFVVLNALIWLKHATKITIRTDQRNIHTHLQHHPVLKRFRGIDIHWKYLPKRDRDEHFEWCHLASRAAVEAKHAADVALPVPVGLKQLSRLWYNQSELSRMEDTSGGDNPAATSPD